MLHAGATLLGGLAGLLLVAAGCTVGDRQPGPAPARLATSPTSADPIGVPRRPLRLLVLEPRAPCPVARPSRSTRPSPRCSGTDRSTRPTAPGHDVTAGSRAAGTTPRCCGSPAPPSCCFPRWDRAQPGQRLVQLAVLQPSARRGLLRLPGRQRTATQIIRLPGMTPPRHLLPCMGLALAAHCRGALISSVPRQSSAAAEGCPLGHLDPGVPVRAGPHATATTGAGLPLWRRPGRSQLGSSAGARAAGAASGRRGG